MRLTQFFAPNASVPIDFNEDMLDNEGKGMHKKFLSTPIRRLFMKEQEANNLVRAAAHQIRGATMEIIYGLGDGSIGENDPEVLRCLGNALKNLRPVISPEKSTS